MISHVLGGTGPDVFHVMLKRPLSKGALPLKGRKIRANGFYKPVIEPLGECRSNHAVLCGLAKRLGCDHPGFQMSDWEVIDRTLRDSGLPDAETLHAERWTDFAPKFEESHFLNGFGHADKKFHFKADWAGVGKVPEGVPTMPGHYDACLLYTSPSPRDGLLSRMPSSA